MSTSFGTQDESMAHLTSRICTLLNSFPLRPEYPDEQKDLQPHIAEVLRRSLPDTQIVISVGEGDSKPSVNLFGTSFWPDIEIRSAGKPVIGIEVKYVRPDKSASKAVAEAIGQSLIYTLRYSTVIVFYSPRGKIQPQTGGLRRSDAATVEIERRRTGSEESGDPQRQSTDTVISFRGYE